MDRIKKCEGQREFTPEQKEELKKAQNIILVFLVIFVLLNIGMFLRFIMSQTL